MASTPHQQAGDGVRHNQSDDRAAARRKYQCDLGCWVQLPKDSYSLCECSEHLSVSPDVLMLANLTNTVSVDCA